MLFKFLSAIGSESLSEIFVEKFFNEVFCFRSDHAFFVASLRPVDVEHGDVINHLVNSFSSKRTVPYHDLICHHTQAPPVNGEVVQRCLMNDLRSDVIRCSDQ
jgi:hypothetical protein